MIYVVIEELIPEMSEGKHSNIGTIAFAVGFYFVNAKNRKINSSLSYGISSIQRCTAEIG